MNATRSLSARDVSTGRPNRFFLSLVIGLSAIGVGLLVALSPTLFLRKHPGPARPLEPTLSEDQLVGDRRATEFDIRPPPLLAVHRGGGALAANPELPARAPSNEEMTDQFLQELKASGETTGGSWTSSAWSVLEGWQNHAKSAVSFSDFHCFSRGCSARASYADFGTFMRENSDIQRSTSWPGPRFHSGPFKTSTGAVEAVWILYRDTSSGQL